MFTRQPRTPPGPCPHPRLRPARRGPCGAWRRADRSTESPRRKGLTGKVGPYVAADDTAAQVRHHLHHRVQHLAEHGPELQHPVHSSQRPESACLLLLLLDWQPYEQGWLLCIYDSEATAANWAWAAEQCGKNIFAAILAICWAFLQFLGNFNNHC